MNIDFDFASKLWRSNKEYIGNGQFKYKLKKCKALTKKNQPCKNKTHNEFCSVHSNY